MNSRNGVATAILITELIRNIIMKKIAFALFLVLASLNSYAFEKIDLPNGRTSMEYSAQVRSFINSVENYKWEAANGEGFHFLQAEKPYDDEFVNQNMYFNTDSFFYGSKTSNRLMYIVQSEYVGFLELIDHETSQSIPVRYLPNGTIQTIQSSGEVMTFSKVSKWSENPNPIEEWENAEESGMIY